MSKQVLTAKDIAEICGISESKSYQVIRQLNEELAKKGYLTFAGRVSAAYFNERMYGMKWGVKNAKKWNVWGYSVIK